MLDRRSSKDLVLTASHFPFGQSGTAGLVPGRCLQAPIHGDPVLPTQVQAPAPADIRVLRGHQLSITCLVITPDDLAIFSAAKDCTIIKCE